MAQHNFTDNDFKIAVSGLIDAIWGKGVIAANRPENINDDVIQVVEDVVNSIKTCSKRMLAVDVTYNFLYTAPGSLREMMVGIIADMVANGIKGAHDPLTTYKGWLNVIRSNRQYRSCINTAALYHRSRLEMAFLGI
ncbi:hypothetical protein [Neisseria weixii]|uniref:hypothetical protein n=1 Tax=Neisseria weixii TaxID=1853276 RepID=UPI00359F1704